MDGMHAGETNSTNIKLLDIIKWAASYGRIDMVVYLHAQYGFEDGEAWIKVAKLYDAAWNGSEVIVHRILLDGVAPYLKNNPSPTPLHIATEKGHNALVKALLAADAVDVNDLDDHGRTALFYSSAHGYITICRQLLEHGASQDHVDIFGETAMSYAQHNKRTEVVDILKYFSEEKLKAIV
jgi:ankyrin repeat protein